MIPFNKPHITTKAKEFIFEALDNAQLSGDGPFTKKCHTFFENRYGMKKALLTTSCTDALEMAAILLDIKEGDEVIAPSYTFVSTVNAFVLRGAIIKFADSYHDNPNIDPEQIRAMITKKTKAIVVVHYAGIACDMDRILEIAGGIPVVEDAAQAIDSYYKGRALGTIGTFGTFSFHETKNIVCGEGGLLSINDVRYIDRAEIIREKGTNRSSFFRGEVNKYGWVDIGSSFLPSELVAAKLYSQLLEVEYIQKKRVDIWNQYHHKLRNFCSLNNISMPVIPSYATNNAHMFYLVCSSNEQRTQLLKKLKDQGVLATFHYVALHSSPYYQSKYKGESLENCDRFSDCLIRLPLYVDLNDKDLEIIIKCITE